MVERARRQKGKQKLLGNHQKCWIWGRNVVLATLRARRWPILEIRLGDRLSEQKIAEVHDLAARDDVTVIVESTEDLSNRCRTSEHQGYVAKMEPFSYDNWETLLACDVSSPLYVILDSIQDPYNFGAIVRSAVAMNADAIFVADYGQSKVTSLVARTSAGAVNSIPIAEVPSLVDLTRRFKEIGINVVAASEKGSQNLYDYDFTQPTSIVIGNEGTGIDGKLLEQCDNIVSIPQEAAIDSLNAAVSAGIVLYEARRQRQIQKTSE